MKPTTIFDGLFSIIQKFPRGRMIFWLVFHLIPVGLVMMGNIRVDTNLFAILPPTNPLHSVVAADKILSERLSGTMTLLIGHQDFDIARNQSLALASKLSHIQDLGDVQCQISETIIQNIQNYYYDNRYRLLSEDQRLALQNNQIDQLTFECLSIISSPVNMGFLDHLDLDPFLFGPIRLQNYLRKGLSESTRLTMRENVLWIESAGIHWILLTVQSKTGIAINSDSLAGEIVRKETDTFCKNVSDLKCLYSGVPFHTAESTRASQFQIGLLSTLSMIAISIFLVFIFRSLIPLIATNLSMVIGVGTGLAWTLIAFGELHIFTIVFGTSLIGISVDYALHYFADRAIPDLKNQNTPIIKRILPGISLGFLTTVVSYGAFLITPFPLLQQIALFSIAGLASSFLSVVLIFPSLPPAQINRNPIALKLGNKIITIFSKINSLALGFKISILACALIMVIIGLSQTKILNNLNTMYTVSPFLQQNEKATADILQHQSRGIYILIEGTDQQNLIHNEYQITQSLNNAVNDEVIKSWTGISQFISPESVQKENFELVEKHLTPHIAIQLQSLGFSKDLANNWRKDFDDQKKRYIQIDDLQKLSLSSLLNILYLGKIGEKYYSAVIVFGVKDTNLLKDRLQDFTFGHLIHKTAEISATLDSLTVQVIILLLISYIVIFIGLLPRYGIKKTLRVCAVPFFASILTFGLLPLLGIPTTIFTVVALILIPGMGIDYALFYIEAQSHKTPVMLAISTSAVTTVLAFGLLAFSNFAASFGLSVALGIFFSFVLTPLMVKRNELSMRDR